MTRARFDDLCIQNVYVSCRHKLLLFLLLLLLLVKPLLLNKFLSFAPANFTFCRYIVSGRQMFIAQLKRRARSKRTDQVKTRMVPSAFVERKQAQIWSQWLKLERGQVNNMNVRVNWFYRVNCRLYGDDQQVFGTIWFVRTLFDWRPSAMSWAKVDSSEGMS